MRMPVNSIARTKTAIVQCRIRENAVNCRYCVHGHAPSPLAGIWTALGSFSSPARRVIDVD
jgi:hypothetical protein